jgi:hypothetical protein
MQIDTDVTGLFGITLAIFVLLVRIQRLQALPLPKRAAVLAAALLVLSIPLWGLSLSGFVRGITGDLSVSTLVLLALAVVHTLFKRVLPGEHERHAMLRAILITAILFYPLALGLGMFDPYRLGYGNLWFMLVLLALTIWSALRYSAFLAVCIALAVVAWSVGWYESPNLWDYLFDPWLAFYALVVQGKYWWMCWRRSVHVKLEP